MVNEPSIALRGKIGIGEHCKYEIKIPKEININTIHIEVNNIVPYRYNFLPVSGPLFLFGCIYTDAKPKELVNKSGVGVQEANSNYHHLLKCSESWHIQLDSKIEIWYLELHSEISFTKNNFINYEINFYHSELIIKKLQDHYKLIPRPKDKIHLIVLSHGINSTKLDMKMIAETINNNFKDKDYQCVILPSDINQTSTFDGLINGGKRLGDFILNYLNFNSEQIIENQHKISFIGHSLGGMYNRYCIGYLYKITNGNFFKVYQPINFITLATPHLGTFEAMNSVHLSLNYGALGQTGKDLLPTNDNKLLIDMSDPNLEYHKALKLFKYLTLYSNLNYDDAVGFYTSCILYSKFNRTSYIKIANIKRGFKRSIEELFERPIEKPTLCPILYDLKSESNCLDIFPNDKDAIINSLTGEILLMAQNLHTNLTWRKVFCYYEYQPHATLTVRRRFQHYLGYPILDHIINEHSF